jgi:hypothetical protein
VLAAIEDTLNCCTMKDPESKVRRPVNATAAGVRKMFEMKARRRRGDRALWHR